MGNKNNYIEERDKMRRKFFEAGCDLVAQQMFDMMCLALSDPEVMTKYRVIKGEQLKVIHDAMYKYEAFYHKAWTGGQEADYFQDKLDDALREIFEKIDKFEDRYPNQKDWDYNKPLKK